LQYCISVLQVARRWHFLPRRHPGLAGASAAAASAATLMVPVPLVSLLLLLLVLLQLQATSPSSHLEHYTFYDYDAPAQHGFCSFGWAGGLSPSGEPPWRPSTMPIERWASRQ